MQDEQQQTPDSASQNGQKQQPKKPPQQQQPQQPNPKQEQRAEQFARDVAKIRDEAADMRRGVMVIETALKQYDEHSTELGKFFRDHAKEVIARMDALETRQLAQVEAVQKALEYSVQSARMMAVAQKPRPNYWPYIGVAATALAFIAIFALAFRL